MLENKCGLVKFVPSQATSNSITVSGMKTTATINFATPGITPAGTTGDITLNAVADDAKWAILLPQEAVANAAVTIGSASYTVNVPAISINDYVTSGIQINNIDHVFSVSESTTVHFSSGNLQAVFAETDNTSCTWQFAPTQYSIVGGATANNAVGNNVVTTTGTVDLFGWVGSSGTFAAYGINNSMEASGYGTTAGEALKHDWSVAANAASLGNHNDWRTLTKDEWYYMFNTRTNAVSKYGTATVCGVHGLVVLPDDWTLPSGCSFTSGTNGVWDENSYDVTSWATMESNGAVFLPAAGYRRETGVYDVGIYGSYWSSTSCEEGTWYSSNSYGANFRSYGLYQDGDHFGRFLGYSVRLVRDID